MTFHVPPPEELLNPRSRFAKGSSLYRSLLKHLRLGRSQGIGRRRGFRWRWRRFLLTGGFLNRSGLTEMRTRFGGLGKRPGLGGGGLHRWTRKRRRAGNRCRRRRRRWRGCR